MSDQKINLIELVVATIALILLLAGFIITILYLYQKKQFAFQKSMEELQLDHEKDILQTQLEIQEQTLENISREIHDNIALGLTLSKLNLNTLPDGPELQDKVGLSVSLIGEAIQNLSNISKSLNADTIRQYGLLRAIENEIGNLQKTGQYKVVYDIEGTPAFMDASVELVIYRILQESFNNILKHSRASKIWVVLTYRRSVFEMSITDNGRGFSFNQVERSKVAGMGSGLNNIQQRAKTIGSECRVVSKTGEGTMIRLTVPLPENEN